MKVLTPSVMEAYKGTNRQFLDNLHEAVSGHLTFGDNMAGQLFKQVTIYPSPFGLGGTVIKHGLHQIPTGFIIINKYNFGDVIADPLKPWTDTEVFLISGGDVLVDIFIVAGR